MILESMFSIYCLIFLTTFQNVYQFLLFFFCRRKLLRKCENRHIPNLVADIKCVRQRIFVSDVQESVFCVKYRKRENQLIIFADDTNPRWITNTCVLDYDTVAMADKFGNVAVMRLPNSISDDVDEDPTGNKALWDRGENIHYTSI